MECYICHRTENEFKKLFDEKLVVLENEIKTLNEELMGIKDKYAKELGFTEETKQKLKAIDKKYLDIKYNSYLENKKLFTEMESLLILLEEYYNKFIIQDYNYILPLRKKGSQNITFNDILESYNNEPYDFRFETRKNELEKQIKRISPYIPLIKETKVFFFETDVPLNTLFQKLNPNRTSYSNYIEPNVFKYVLNNKIYLCLYCAALINGASQASFNIKMAEEMEEQQRMDEMEEEWDEL